MRNQKPFGKIEFPKAIRNVDQPLDEKGTNDNSLQISNCCWDGQ